LVGVKNHWERGVLMDILYTLKKLFKGQKHLKSYPVFIYPLLIEETSRLGLVSHKAFNKEDIEKIIGEALRRSDGDYINIQVREEARQVELRQIYLTTPDIDFIKKWLRLKDDSRDDPGINQYVEHLMHEIVNEYERAEVKEIL